MSLGIDVGGTKLMLALERNDGTKVFKRTPTGPSFQLSDFQNALTSFLKETSQNEEIKIQTVGIAICGLIEEDTGNISICELPKLCGWNPSKFLSDQFHCKVNVVNDAVAALLYVIKNLSRDDAKNVAVLVAGTGIGSAFSVEGNMLRGAHSLGGNLGCVVVQCPSQSGDTMEYKTIDEIAGGRALVRNLLPLAPQEAIQRLESMKENGLLNEECWTEESKKSPEYNLYCTIRDTAIGIGLAISMVLNIFNPSLIVLGGGVLNFPGIFDMALESAKKNTKIVPELFTKCKIIESPHKNELVALGALEAGKQ